MTNFIRKILAPAIFGMGIFVFTFSAAYAAGPWFVADTGNDITNDCLSAATPCMTIQAAVNKASAGDTINVAAGATREITFRLDRVGNFFYWGALKGLSSFADREWLDSQLTGAFIVNLGDSMMSWTNGEFVSTPHRVVNRSTLDRYIVALFMNPDFHCVVEPLAEFVSDDRPAMFEPVHNGEYWWNLAQTAGYQ
jgi:hypothetical protein